MVWHKEKSQNNYRTGGALAPTLPSNTLHLRVRPAQLQIIANVFGLDHLVAHEACFQVTTAVAWLEGQFLRCLLEAKRAAVTVSEFDSRRSHSCSSFPAPSAPSALCDLKPPSVSHTVACFLLKMHRAPVQGFHFYLLSDWEEMHH